MADDLADRLQEFSRSTLRLKGVSRKRERGIFVAQLVDSIRRVEYIRAIRRRDVCDARSDPSSDLFDPLRSALQFQQKGMEDEAFWMVFLFTHFSKHAVQGWQLVREVYGGLGRRLWTWEAVSTQTSSFCRWLDRNYDSFQGKFGNHRKYESLDPAARHCTSQVVQSYVDWIGPSKSHDVVMTIANEESDGTPDGMFKWLMKDTQKVLRFGRLARFDHLTMLGKLGLADIRPGSPFLQGATGPLRGARLLFDGDPESRHSAIQLDSKVVELGTFLGVGMQEMEDAMCNWQKSPSKYRYFRG